MLCELPCALDPATLGTYTRPGLIIPCLDASDPAGIIKELTHRLRIHDIIGDLLPFYHAALNHEFLSNSALCAGIAIPHARSPQVRRLTLAVGRASAPVVWGAKGSWPVELVFLLAVPSTAAQDYLALLSAIVRLTRQPEMPARLKAAADALAICEILKEVRLQDN